jgi:MFS family permease
MGRMLSHRYGVLLALLNLFALLLGMMIVDKIGRKPLLIAGSAGMALCLLLLVWGLRHHIAAPFYLVILASYNTFFACSQGAAAWVYLSEIFPFPVRGKGQGFGALVHWIANAGLIWLFPVMEHALPQSSFLLFASLMILQIAIVSLWYPETKGTRLGAVAEVAQPSVAV